MSYTSLWGAADTPFMMPNQVLLSTPSTTKPLGIMAKANSGTPYFTPLAAGGATIPAGVLSIGAFESAPFPYYSTIDAPVPTYLKERNIGVAPILPVGVEASASRPYFTK